MCAVQKSCRPCGNSMQHLRGRTFFHTSHGKRSRSESEFSGSHFFRKVFFFRSKSASFHTVCLSFAPRYRAHLPFPSQELSEPKLAHLASQAMPHPVDLGPFPPHKPEGVRTSSGSKSPPGADHA